MWRYLTIEVIFFILFMIFVFYLHHKYGKRGNFEFKGLREDDFYDVGFGYEDEDDGPSFELPKSRSKKKKKSRKSTSTKTTSNDKGGGWGLWGSGEKVGTETSPQGKKKWKGEERCREILQQIYKKPFPSSRPDFLKNPATNKNLELDCYCDSLKIALEYDGAQHANYTPRFHRDDKWNFVYQVRKDDWKTKKCEEMGITLIRIPHYVQHEKLESYIRKKLEKAGKL